MATPAPAPERSGALRVLAAALATASALTGGGCALNGDFDRVRPSLVHPNIHAWLGRQAARDRGQPASKYELTDDERQLRDLAFPLIDPPYERGRWYGVIREYGADRAFRRDFGFFDRAAYGEKLMAKPYRSANGRYAQLAEDVRNDITRIGSFFNTARRVIDIDIKREKSLAHVRGLTKEERDNALSRMGENTLVVAWVERALGQRADSYRHALERLVIATPSPMAVEIERVLGQLHTQIEGNRVVVARGGGPKVHVSK